ncbi:MAG: glycoside hydrolase family 2 TIM barrel-domain containing protein [Verrucomicrobiota bacterium]
MESHASAPPGHGPGRYKLDEAWRIDYLVNLAERLGIRLMCCLETQQYLRRDAWWAQFSYNAANGGPVTTPADFFVNPHADAFFRKRLRYIVARWAYSPAVFSWQFWNEVSACNDFRPEPAAAWHRRMAQYLRSIDPYGHIIHSNFGNMDGYQEVDGLPEMEVVSSNIYSRRDMGRTAVWGARMMTARYRKPYLLTEYGVGHRGGWVKEDPSGVIVHNGLWGAVVGGRAGAGMPWGWDYWIDQQECKGKTMERSRRSRLKLGAAAATKTN